MAETKPRTRIMVVCLGGHAAAFSVETGESAPALITEWCQEQRHLHAKRFPDCRWPLEIHRLRAGEPAIMPSRECSVCKYRPLEVLPSRVCTVEGGAHSWTWLNVPS